MKFAIQFPGQRWWQTSSSSGGDSYLLQLDVEGKSLVLMSVAGRNRIRCSLDHFIVIIKNDWFRLYMIEICKSFLCEYFERCYCS